MIYRDLGSQNWRSKYKLPFLSPTLLIHPQPFLSPIQSAIIVSFSKLRSSTLTKMQTRHSKRLRYSSESDDDIRLSSMFSKNDNPNSQQHEMEPEVHEPSQPSTMEKPGPSSKKKSKGKHKVSTQSRRRQHRSSMPVTPSINLSDNFFRGLNFESRFKTFIVSKTLVYEKTIDVFFYQNSHLKTCFESSSITSMVF